MNIKRYTLPWVNYFASPKKPEGWTVKVFHNVSIIEKCEDGKVVVENKKHEKFIVYESVLISHEDEPEL